jgi:hypothetical protein
MVKSMSSAGRRLSGCLKNQLSFQKSYIGKSGSLLLRLFQPKAVMEEEEATAWHLKLGLGFMYMILSNG